MFHDPTLTCVIEFQLQEELLPQTGTSDVTAVAAQYAQAQSGHRGSGVDHSARHAATQTVTEQISLATLKRNGIVCKDTKAIGYLTDKCDNGHGAIVF